MIRLSTLKVTSQVAMLSMPRHISTRMKIIAIVFISVPFSKWQVEGADLTIIVGSVVASHYPTHASFCPSFTDAL
ncbi:hypothetical protein MUP59_08260 [Candidatus Bathyarchaeota archaeon]|nr:hypothetical protein [Candidatus Bathyarchaeota archaeon]